MNRDFSNNDLFEVISPSIKTNIDKQKVGLSYYNIFDILKESIFVVKKNFTTLYINSAFEMSFGFKKKDVIGKILPIFLAKEFIEKKNIVLKKLFSQGKWEDEIIYQNSEEVDFNVQISLNLLKNNNDRSEVIIGTCRDLTALKVSDDLSNKRNSLLNLFNDVIKFTNRSTDTEPSIKHAINKVCQYTLWDIGHCYLMKNNKLISTKIWNSNLDKKYNSFKNYTEKVTYITKEGMPRKCIQQAKPIWLNLNELENIYPFKRYSYIIQFGIKSGIWIPIMINKDAAGVLEFFSDSDISVDNEIMYAISNICLEIGSLLDRIETFNSTKVNEKLTALGRFSAGMAHELRNPLANISALSQLLLKDEKIENNKKHLSYIIENTRIANKIITNLLNYASSDELNLKYMDFEKFLNKILEIAEPRILEKKIKIIKKISPKLPYIYIDEIKIENAIMNFITNSIDALPEGGIIIFDASKRLKESILLKIKDNGIGIPEENLDKIFEPFFSTKNTGTGLGMGLALQTIKSHGGSLKIKSKENSGTTIEIKIPLRKEI